MENDRVYPYHHYPGCQEICRDGVIYYLASYKGKRSLMRFDLSSEDFNVTKLPEDRALQWFGELVNHAGMITIAALRCGPVDLWVLEDVNKEVWSKTVVVVPSLPDRFGMSHKFVFKGILGTGEMIFAPMTSPSPNPFFFLCYNPEGGGEFRKIVIVTMYLSKSLSIIWRVIWFCEGYVNDPYYCNCDI